MEEEIGRKLQSLHRFRPLGGSNRNDLGISQTTLTCHQKRVLIISKKFLRIFPGELTGYCISNMLYLTLWGIGRIVRLTCEYNLISSEQRYFSKIFVNSF